MGEDAEMGGMMNFEEKARALVDYIRKLPNFKILASNRIYGHMGATITDAMLQADAKWKTVVRPKRDKIWQYPQAQTTSGFLALIKCQSKGDELWEGVAELLDWHDQEKPERIVKVTEFLRSEGLETEADLRVSLQRPGNEGRLDSLRGIGRKTVGYFKIRAGIPGSAVDRWLRRFLAEAHIPVSGDLEIKHIIDEAAEQMGIDKSTLDAAIWRHMSGDC